EDALASEKTDGERRETLRRQLKDLPYAHISTFHSFAISVIRRFFHLIDIEPGFTVCDESRAFLMKKDALDELMEQEYEAGRKEFLALLDKYTAGRSDASLKCIISDKQGLYEKLMSLPDPWGWAEEAVDRLRLGDADLEDSHFWKYYSGALSAALESALEMEDLAASMLTDSGLDRIAADYRAKGLTPVRNALDALRGDYVPSDTIEEIRRALSGGYNTRRLTGNKDEKPLFKQIEGRVKLYRDASKEQIDRVKEMISEPLEETVFEIGETADDAAELMRLVREFDRIYSEMKAEEKVIDFTDIEHLCLKILDNEEACEAYRREISYIFIDEYQDTNMLRRA
ncbi:MAG: UvrD-helicase domain-containing protein, partial [Firmicutes bacterium]|nr:UvrD-helicase domain-containing protein [Bacillota bacterium]